MTAQMRQNRLWRALKRWMPGAENSPAIGEQHRRMTIDMMAAYRLPHTVSAIHVVHGAAWISHLREDLLLHTGQTLHLLPDREGIVVSALGREPLELEMCH